MPPCLLLAYMGWECNTGMAMEDEEHGKHNLLDKHSKSLCSNGMYSVGNCPLSLM